MRQGVDVRRRAVVVVGVGRRRAAPRSRTPRARPAAGCRRPASASAVASSTPMPDALSSAPGACGTVSRCAPTSSHGSPGHHVTAGGHQVDRRPAGHRNAPRHPCRSRRTAVARPSSPAGSAPTRPSGRPGSTPARCPVAARPVPARCRTADIAVAARTSSGSARGSRGGRGRRGGRAARVRGGGAVGAAGTQRLGRSSVQPGEQRRRRTADDQRPHPSPRHPTNAGRKKVCRCSGTRRRPSSVGPSEQS